MKFLWSIVVTFQVLSATAATRYVSQNGLPPNTNSLAGLNAWTNVAPGDTVWLCGTLTNGVDTSAGYVGALGNPVTFYFEPGANFTAPAWGQKFNSANSFNNGNAFYLPSVYAVVIDGGSNGYIRATANGAMGYTWSNRCDGINIQLLGGSLEIKNLSVTNLYQRNNGDKDAYTPGHVGDDNYIVSGNAVTIGGEFTNCSIHNCKFSETGNLLSLSTGGDTKGLNVYSNSFTHCSFGLQVYGGGDGQDTGYRVWGNTFNIGDDWSGNNTVFHGNGIILNKRISQSGVSFYDPDTTTNFYNGGGSFSLSIPEWGDYGSYYNWYAFGNTNNTGILDGTNLYTTTVSFFAKTNFVVFKGTPGVRVSARLNRIHAGTNYGMVIDRNYFGPTWGTNTSNWIGVYNDMPGGVQAYKIYNNVVVIDNITSPTIIGNSLAAANGCLVANNSIIQLNVIPVGTGYTAGFGGGTVYNNLLYNFAHAAAFNDANSDQRGWGWFTAIDYNCYYGLRGITNEWRPNQGEAWPALWYDPGATIFYPAGTARYRQADGYELHSKTNQPLLSATYAPLTNDVVLITNGLNLTFLGITNDFYGNPRPAVGAWTVGAFQDANTNNLPPSVPTFTLTLMPSATTSQRTNGEVVSLSCTNAGLFAGWSATAGSIATAASCSTTFTMPGAPATVTASYTNAAGPPPDPPTVTSNLNFIRIRK